MKIAISNIAWEPAEDDTVRALMREFGTAGVELAPTKIWSNPATASEAEVDRARREWNNAGFQVAALQSLLFGRPELTVFDGEQSRAATGDYLQQVMLVAGRLGAGALVFGSPKNRRIGNTQPAEIERIARGFFQAMAKSAVVSNTCFCLEPNPPEYGCDYVTTVDEALEVIRAIDHPGLRLNLDTGIMAMNREPVEATIEAALPWIGHIHLSEPQLAVVGSGAVDHARIAEVLKKLGYDGWVSIEMRSSGNGANATAVESALKAAHEFYG
jgi:sugar phosphate isomerase/epimerase